MPIRLSEEEREILTTEVAQALDHVRSPELRVTYGELLTAVDLGEVPEELAEPLQTLLEVGLESGRIREAHLAHGEMAAQRVYARTPRGKILHDTTAEVNAALQALGGQRIEQVTVSPRGAAGYSIRVTTEDGAVLLVLDRGGARVQSVEIG
jgi:hypothetical protein